MSDFCFSVNLDLIFFEIYIRVFFTKRGKIPYKMLQNSKKKTTPYLFINFQQTNKKQAF